MRVRVLLLAGGVALLSACKTTPDAPPVTAPVTEAVTTVPAPQPVQPIPAPASPVVINETPPTNINLGPPPGTVADFLYQSGGEGRVFFDYNKYDLNVQSQDALRRQAQWLQTYSNVAAVVEGNADERGTREYNLALAARRAESVKSFLVSQGVAPNRLTTVSYGKERPIDGRSSEEGWARNRNSHTNLMSGTIG